MNSSGQSFSEATDLFGRMVRAANFALDTWWVWLSLAFFVWLAFRLRAHHALLAQLDECLKIQPDLRNQGNFVNTYLTKLHPSPDENWRQDPAATA